MERESEDMIVCPHCDEEHHEYWEYINTEDDYAEFELECERCQNTFDVRMFVTTTFYSSPKGGEGQ